MSVADFTITKLYRDCLRTALHLGTKEGNTKALVASVRRSFRKHDGETDPQKIEKLKESAVRGLTNYLFLEAQKMARAHGGKPQNIHEDIPQGQQADGVNGVPDESHK
ncbi:hypothetical protein BSKO_04074 [Bryopsis sp. KO-2023]|nr:hypothetical protein BSKO_04074 [Bryopsis sp. KO-2023]